MYSVGRGISRWFGPDPVADHACAQHVSHQFVVGPIPHKKRGTGTAAAVHFEEAVVFHSGNLDFVLNHAGGPQHAHHVGLFGLAESDHEVGRVLSQIAGRARDFKLLAIRSGEDFDLGANRALVVGQALERKPHPVVLVAAFVAQQHGRTVVLRDEQVGGAVTVVVGGDNGAGILELNLVQTNVGGDIFESIRPEVAEETDFTFTLFRFSHRDEVDPAVVIVVERGHSPAAGPVGYRKGHRLKVFPW